MFNRARDKDKTLDKTHNFISIKQSCSNTGRTDSIGHFEDKANSNFVLVRSLGQKVSLRLILSTSKGFLSETNVMDTTNLPIIVHVNVKYM